MPQTKRLVLEVALNHLFTEKYFSVCTLDKILDVAEVSRKSAAYKLLSALHCVHYDQMTREVREALPHLVREALTPVTPCEAAEIALRDWKEE